MNSIFSAIFNFFECVNYEDQGMLKRFSMKGFCIFLAIIDRLEENQFQAV